MADEASIRMTVDSSPAITENQKYVRAATETFNILKQKSIELGVAEKQRLDWMQREVELMKERSRLSTAETVNRLYEDPRLSTKDRARLVRETRAEGRDDIEELKLINKNLKEQINTQKTEAQKSERLGQQFSRFIPQLFAADTAGGVASAGTGLLAGLGVAGLLAGIVVSKGLRGAAEMDPAIRDYAVLMGSSMTGVKGAVSATGKGGMFGNDIAQMGMTPAEYFTKYAQLYRAGGGVVNENMLGIMAGEKARGVSLAGVMGVERYGEGKVTNIERYFEKYLRDTGQKIAVLSESLQLFTSEASRMVRVAGRVDTEAIAASIATIGKGFGLKGEPLQNVYAAMNQGLQQSTNPAVQAMQYSAMERAMPGASLWQMQMAMTNPLENPKYVKNMLDLLRKTSVGGQEGYARNIANVLGIDPIMADKLSRGEYSPETFAKEAKAFKQTPTGGYQGAAVAVTGATERVGAGLKGEAQRLGFNTAEAFAEELKNLLGSFSNSIAATNEGIQATLSFGQQQLSEVSRSNTLLQNWIKIVSGLSATGSQVGLGPAH